MYVWMYEIYNTIRLNSTFVLKELYIWKIAHDLLKVNNIN